MLTIALKTMIGKDKFDVPDLPNVNLLKINKTLKQILAGFFYDF